MDIAGLLECSFHRNRRKSDVSKFHPLIAGIMISGAIAAMMSTADSQLLVVSSAVVEDI